MCRLPFLGNATHMARRRLKAVVPRPKFLNLVRPRFRCIELRAPFRGTMHRVLKLFRNLMPGPTLFRLTVTKLGRTTVFETRKHCPWPPMTLTGPALVPRLKPLLN